MISVIYVVLSAFIIGHLSMIVIRTRRKYKISVGDGGNEELLLAIGAQSNAVEYLPIALILLLSLELNGAGILLIHLFGITLIISRIIHARGLLSNNMRQRVIGMQITFYTIIALAVMNMVYMPYGKIIEL